MTRAFRSRQDLVSLSTQDSHAELIMSGVIACKVARAIQAVILDSREGEFHGLCRGRHIPRVPSKIHDHDGFQEQAKRFFEKPRNTDDNDLHPNPLLVDSASSIIESDIHTQHRT